MRLSTPVRSALIIAALLPATGWAQLSAVSENFENYDASDPTTLSTGELCGAELCAIGGWLVFTNVFHGANGSFLYSQGPSGAPNSDTGFSAVVTGEGGPEQGQQQLETFSDYDNADHNNGHRIETTVYQEQIIASQDVGRTWSFHFDVRRGDLAGSSTAFAFIRTLDPSFGFSLSSFTFADLTPSATTWSDGQVSLAIDASLLGHIVQFGFGTSAKNFEPSGMFYDNVVFADAVTDDDGDGIDNTIDNCCVIANPDQRDTNGDGFGNICDPDLDGNGIINFLDRQILEDALFSSEADADLDGSGLVDYEDRGILLSYFFSAPGPSAINGSCGSGTSGVDNDADAIPDSDDNCLEVQNTAQWDHDLDGIGNACDGDVAEPNDCTVNLLDLLAFRQNFLQSYDLADCLPPFPSLGCPATDFNADGITNLLDLLIFRGLFLQPVGSSGIPNVCN